MEPPDYNHVEVVGLRFGVRDWDLGTWGSSASSLGSWAGILTPNLARRTQISKSKADKPGYSAEKNWNAVLQVDFRV